MEFWGIAAGKKGLSVANGTGKHIIGNMYDFMPFDKNVTPIYNCGAIGITLFYDKELAIQKLKELETKLKNEINR